MNFSMLVAFHIQFMHFRLETSFYSIGKMQFMYDIVI